MAKFIFIIMRGVALFIRYFKINLLSVVALATLFTVLHTVFALGGGASTFAKNAARFDKIRVYHSLQKQADVDSLKAELEKIDGVAKAAIYSQEDTKRYLNSENSAVTSLSSLPKELFPTFIELIAGSGYDNVEALEKISSEASHLKNVDSVSYGKEWAHKMDSGKKAVSAIIFTCSVFFIFAALVMIYQTVRVTMYSYREEIRIYSVVGGTASFIISPFMCVAACMAALAGLLSFAGYFLIEHFLLSSLGQTVGLALKLNFKYCVEFFAVAIIFSIIAGFISANAFLSRAYYINEN